jgi:RNA polymerase sigma factor for flagellar operon FliA
VSYGILGLIDAIDKFDLSKNVKFETYANIRIRGAIVDQMRNLDWIPRSIRQKYKKVEDSVKKLQNIYGDDIKDEYLAKEMNVSLEELYEILNDISGLVVVSLDEFLQNGKNFDISSGSIEINPQDALEKKESEKLIKEVIENLPEKEKKVISLYYYSELTYKEIANVLGISESRVSQLHTSAIAKLKIKLKY